MTNQERIQITLGFSKQGYMQMIELTGYKWAQCYFTKDAKMKECLIKSKRFWQWWNNHWKHRDSEFLYETSLRFIDEPLTGDELQIATEMFINKHRVSSLNVHPNKWVKDEVSHLLILARK